jgi:hypothetical protein
MADRVLHEVPSTVFFENLGQMVELSTKLATDLITEHALLVDITGAGKVCALALYRLAIEFDLPCLFVTELGAVTWLRQ